MATSPESLAVAPNYASFSSTRSSSNAGNLNIRRKPALRVRQAVRDNNVALLSRLQRKFDLRNTDKNRITSLAWAALECNLEAFEWLLLDYGHDDQELSRDAQHHTIFHLLAAAPAPPALSPLADILTSSTDFPPRPETRSREELVEISLRITEIYYTLFPFLLDWSNKSGKTALHIASQADNVDFIALLCDLGADLDLVDLQGNTPLHYASAWGQTESVRMLLERGASIVIRNYEGYTAADIAYSHASRAALDSIARDTLQVRKARRKEERMREREAREAEAREYYERDQLEMRSQYERSLYDQRSGYELSVFEGTSPGHGQGWPRSPQTRSPRSPSDPSRDDGSYLTSGSYVSASTPHAGGSQSASASAQSARVRSLSNATSMTTSSARSSRSRDSSTGPHGPHGSTRERDEPPLPPLPPDVAAAAAELAASRRAALERGRYSTNLSVGQGQALGLAGTGTGAGSGSGSGTAGAGNDMTSPKAAPATSSLALLVSPTQNQGQTVPTVMLSQSTPQKDSPVSYDGPSPGVTPTGPISGSSPFVQTPSPSYPSSRSGSRNGSRSGSRTPIPTPPLPQSSANLGGPPLPGGLGTIGAVGPGGPAPTSAFPLSPTDRAHEMIRTPTPVRTSSMPGYPGQGNVGHAI